MKCLWVLVLLFSSAVYADEKPKFKSSLANYYMTVDYIDVDLPHTAWCQEELDALKLRGVKNPHISDSILEHSDDDKISVFAPIDKVKPWRAKRIANFIQEQRKKNKVEFVGDRVVFHTKFTNEEEVIFSPGEEGKHVDYYWIWTKDEKRVKELIVKAMIHTRQVKRTIPINE